MSDDHFSVNFGSGGGRKVNLDEIRKRKESFMPDGGHAWCINTVFALDDPEAALDSMVLGDENFIGVTDIHCMLCNVGYQSLIRHFKCPQATTMGQR